MRIQFVFIFYEERFGKVFYLDYLYPRSGNLKLGLTVQAFTIICVRLSGNEGVGQKRLKGINRLLFHCYYPT